MAQSNWEADKMLDVYIYDHLVKKKLHNTANSFMTERKVSPDHVAIDTPGGFLFERWSMFLDIYNAKTKEKLLDSAVEYELNVYIYDYLVKKKLHYTAYSFMTEVKVSMDPVAIDTPGGYLSQWWSVFWAFFVASTNEKHSESAAEAHQGGVSAAIQSSIQQTPLINMPQGQQSSSHQQDPFQSQQPSTYTPVERVAITRNMPKGPMMYGYDANQLRYEMWADMDPFGDVGALDDEDVERVFNFINWNPSEYYIEAQQDKAKEQQIQMKQPNPMNTETSQPGTTYNGEMDQGNHQGGGVSAAVLKQLKSRTQQTPLEAGEGESRKRCKCKKSKCLQLKCECFAAGVYCSTEPPCSCLYCHNIPIHNDTIWASRENIESRDPLAFTPKIIGRSSDSVQETREGDASKTPASGRHRRGCNCKKSNCSKKYCECFQGDAGCSIKCRCEDCKNTFGVKPSS
ncbi:hypothetical protein HID58_051822 [Brassica napus]|uniref:CRC domain-containing protein n=1 Tax=Brassica napus TaxID=3708 RepID=A0ABQ8AAH3_BRANA|nr:PREDICTED: uncharacterized protein LOC106333301 [Brassica oleracea var. oleracea]XP_013627217.1 PREDICTED: uncharacterized protein LOC106333301 [Brassica oleracea var. oleracea]XP_013680755.1 uncharacterized protein LOC106385373 [Brassica napus]XP_022554718.1 uncharacterized protein LOC106385373 [Brassica napus]KAH0889393.1 hypothetical protein HID58_051822 [Brassica napus]